MYNLQKLSGPSSCLELSKWRPRCFRAASRDATRWSTVAPEDKYKYSKRATTVRSCNFKRIFDNFWKESYSLCWLTETRITGQKITSQLVGATRGETGRLHWRTRRHGGKHERKHIANVQVAPQKFSFTHSLSLIKIFTNIMVASR